jgi:uncharacterized membrane protein
MKTIYWILTVLVLISCFTLIIPTIYHVVTGGRGYANVFDVVHDKFNPEAKRWSAFFKPIY